MQLTARTLLLLLTTVVWLVLGSAATGFLWLAAGWLVVIVAVMLADWRLTPGPSAWTLARSHDDRLSLATKNRIVIAVRLRRGLREVPVWLRDEPPLTFTIDDSERVLAGRVHPGTSEKMSYSVYPPRRGNYRFGDLHLRWESALGLLRRQAVFAASEPVKVYPNLANVQKYDLLVRRNRLWELGLRNARVFGSGTEFERLREYRPDDEYRRINWKATARRAKPISIEYETERSQSIIALLDTGRMMRSPIGDVAKLDYAINAVLLLAYVAARKGDKIGLLTFADEAQTWIAPGGGKRQFHRMLEQLYAVEGEPVEPDYDVAFGYFAAHQSKRSLVVVFTDLTGSISTRSLVAQMSRLRRRHLALLVTVRDPAIQRLARQDVLDSTMLYRRTVAEQLMEERRLVMDQLQRQGVLTLDVAADELSVAVINRYLNLKARTLL